MTIRTDDRERGVGRRPKPRPALASATAVAARPVAVDADRGGHRIASCARNRRMLRTITGMIASSRTTATALPGRSSRW